VISPAKDAVSRAVRPAKAAISTTLRIAGRALGDLDFAQSAKGSVRGAPIKHGGQPNPLAIARARPSAARGKKISNRSGKSPKDVLEHRLADARRARMLEHHADAEPCDPVRWPARDLTGSTRNRARSGRSTRGSFITVDLPDPFGPMSRESRRHEREADVPDRRETAEPLLEALTSSLAAGALMSLRAP